MPEGFKLRAHGRIKTRCILYYLGEQVSGTGSVRDISLAGWRIVGDHPVTEGTTLSLRIFLPTVQEPIHIDAATVQWVKGREFGLRITQMSPSSETAIKAFLQAALQEPGAPLAEE